MQFVRYVLYHNRMKRYGIHHLLCLGVEGGGGGSNTDNVSLLNYFGKIKTSCLDLIFFFFFCQKALWDKMQNFRGRGAITGAIYLWTSGVDLICS